ncbi:MAG TPA: type II secretion system F family protein [Bryobacteraceae bacterium]
MPGYLILMFGAVFGITLAAVALAYYFIEQQRRKRVSAMLTTVTAKAAAPEAQVLVESKDPGALMAVMSHLNLANKAEDSLRQAGLDWNATRLVSAMAAGALVGALAGLKIRVLLVPELSALALAVVFALLPLLYVLRKRKKHMLEFEKQFPDALDFMARALKAGHAFSASLEMLARESPDPLQGEFWKVYNQQTLGAPLSEVLRHLAERVPLVDVRFFVSAVVMQRESGGNLGEILTNLARVIRERFRLKGKVKAASAHGRFTAATLTLLPVATALVLMSVDPVLFMQMAHDPIGKDMIAFAIVAQVIGFFVMRKIVNFKV